MSKITLTGFALLSVLFFGNSSENYAVQPRQNASDASTGRLQKMIIENGSVTLNVDLNGLNGSNALVTRPATLQFAAATNSFFSILVFNDQLRGAESGSIALVPQGRPVSLLPSLLAASLKQLVVEKLPADSAFDMAVRDAKTGFTFFKIEGHQYDYDARGQLLDIQNGRLLMSKEFAAALGRPADVNSAVGKISISARMKPIEVTKLINGEPKSMVMPALHVHVPLPGTTPGPDVIVGDLPAVQQFGSAGTQVGVAVATTSCNAGTIDLDWFALPQTDHPVIPQNLYRMSGGADNTERFEQIGQSWLKHTFEALEESVCATCNTSGCETGTHLCPGCSDPYVSGLNGDQNQIGSRAWVNPFTGAFPSNANDHSGHNHDGVSHRVLVETSDLMPGGNPGATYY